MQGEIFKADGEVVGGNGGQAVQRSIQRYLLSCGADDGAVAAQGKA